jgi:sugar transferase (PEP-CTERM system associated)
MVRIFRHYVPTFIVALVAIDVAVLIGSMYAGIWLRFMHEPGGLSQHLPIFPRALIFTVVIIGCMSAFGVYLRDTASDRVGFWLRFGATFVTGFVIMSMLLYAFRDIVLWRGAFGLSLLLAMSGMALVRVIHFATAGNKSLKKRILILGTGSRAAQVEDVLAKHNLNGKFEIVGYLSAGGTPGHVDPKKMLLGTGSLLGTAIKHDVDEVVVAVRDRRGGNLPMADLLECKIEGVNVIEVSSFFERETGHVQVDSLNPSWLVFSDGFCRSSARSLLKRIFDVVVSFAMLVLTLPVMALTALAIWIESGRPIFYRQARVGECGHVFYILKFRSMRVDAERDGAPVWAQKGDNRVTAVGGIIRKLRIDELPQIFNVLKGDMSFVGPRPERPVFVDELSRQIPYYSNRHAVKPGITGWAQVNYPYGASVNDAREKLQYDLYYIKNHSVFLDFVILAQTAQVVLFGKGAR